MQHRFMKAAQVLLLGILLLGGGLVLAYALRGTPASRPLPASRGTLASRVAPAPAQAVAPTPAQAVAPTTLADAPYALRTAFVRARQAEGAADARLHVRRDGADLVANNVARGVRARFDARGVALTGAAVVGRLDADELRCDGRAAAIGAGVARVDRAPHRVVVERDSFAGFQLREWYANGPLGLEQGFDVDAPGCDGELAITLATPGFAPVLDGAAVRLARADGAPALRYAELVAEDATGRALPARFAVADGRVTLAVDARGARWPVAIDPLLYQEEQRVGPETSGDGAVDDAFGWSVALSGDRALIGAPQDDVGANADQGSAYIFVRVAGVWSLEAKLTATDGAADDHFGWSVALSGATALVGAYSERDFGEAQGVAYVFVGAAGVWSQQARLTAAGGVAGNGFGFSVALDGETALVGARSDPVGTRATQGTARVFVRTGEEWAEQAVLVATAGAAGDRFGASVALDGETALVGADLDDVGVNSDQGSATVFVRVGALWSEQAQLVASVGAAGDGAGGSVALDGATALLGAERDDVGGRADQGSVTVFVQSGSSWSEQAQLHAADGSAGDRFGSSVALSGATALCGAASDTVGASANRGSAYVFLRAGSLWSQQARLNAADGATGDRFGGSVGLDGATALVGAPVGDVGSSTNQGSAYAFVRTGSSWSQQSELTAGEGASGDRFGAAVALHGDTAVVGAQSDDLGTRMDQGSAYVFVRDGAVWSQQARLVASDGAASDQFGISVALFGESALIGAHYDSTSTSAFRGAAYVFVRDGTVWSQQAKLTATDAAAFDRFGTSVALYRDTALIGAVNDDVGPNLHQGSAYAFVRDGTTWSQQARLVASDGAAGDQFGHSVALFRDTALCGAPNDMVGTRELQGTATVFVRAGVEWFEQVRLVQSDGVAFDRFGFAVAVSGDTALVGSQNDDVDTTSNQGTASLFVRAGSLWSHQAALLAPDGAGGDIFGAAVALSGDLALVGAPLDDVGANVDQGSATVYLRAGSVWSTLTQVVSSDGAANHQFGFAVTLDVADTAVGVPQHQGALPLANPAQGAMCLGHLVAEGAIPCASATECVSGFCVDGVCCDTACGDGALDDCMACIGWLNGGTHGTCLPLSVGAAPTIECRPATGACDVAETCVGGTTVCPEDLLAPVTTMCRLAGGTCGLAEYCNGTAVTCPRDVRRSASTECRVAAGVCDVAESCDGTGDRCGEDAKLPATAECRPSLGACDVVERCDGASDACAPDALEPASTVCRAAAGACDLVESCTGTFFACPLDRKQVASTVCRAAAGDCDRAESCNGATNACPEDEKIPSATVCRPGAGTCDAIESCNGLGDTCPVDELLPAFTTCRAAGGACDLVESCSGTSSLCPVDVRVAAATVCRASGGDCDLAESCNGTSSACPENERVPPTTICRASRGLCDLAESCTGATDSCPGDALRLDSTTCRAAGGACDFAETCTGASDACPPNVLVPAAVVCRASSGACDLAESCNGVTGSCPSDEIAPATTVCRAAAGTCDLLETCTGSNNECPPDLKARAAIVCRASGGDCDLAEFCTGAADACPADLLVLPTTLCRVSSGDCDIAESCTGATSACPDDRFVAATTVCRATLGDCDPAESCTGTSALCPPAVLASATEVCRVSSGDCDPAETCSGITASCPTDLVASALFVCRASAGDCDPAETCDGATLSCSADLLAPAATLCHAAGCDAGAETVAALCAGDRADCPVLPAVSCGLFACGVVGGIDACLTDCVADGECVVGALCVDGACVAQLDLGVSCSEQRQCLSGFCTDGVCCVSACGGQCEACAESGSEGACVPSIGAPRGPRPVCSGDGTVCNGTCSGLVRSSCAFLASGLECRTGVCEGGFATDAAFCTATGFCSVGATDNCTPFVCAADGLTCAGDCTTHSECVVGRYCRAGACVPKLGAGAPCATGTQCASDHCVDDVCCDTDCDEQCEACAEPDSLGTCAPVTGAPRGARDACFSSGGVCGGDCNGTNPNSCTYPDEATRCGERRCDSAMLIDVGSCDSTGSCDDPPAMLCEHGCFGGDCLGCLTDQHCAVGEICIANLCIATPPVEPDGCACRAAGEGRARHNPLLALLAIALVARFIRRRRTV